MYKKKLISGDIESNPGPVKYPYSSCQKAVRKNDKALLCDSCNKCWHIRSKCGNVKVSKYDSYQKMDNLNWICPPCRQTMISNHVPNVGDTGIKMLPEHEAHLNRINNAAAFYPKKGFSILHLNTRSFFPKIDEIRLFAKENPYHILAFSETWLSSSISSSEIQILGYADPVRCDRKYSDQPGGGLAVYFKQSVPNNEITSISCQKIEATAIKVSPSNSPSFILIAVHRPSSHSPLEPHLTNFLDGVIESCPSMDDVVMLGDFNLNQLERNNTTVQMDNICLTYSLQQLIDLPTRVTETSSTLIDLIFVSEQSYVLLSGVIPMAISDHFGIFLSRIANKSGKTKKDHIF